MYRTIEPVMCGFGVAVNVRIARCRWFDSVLILDLQHGVVEYVHWR